MIKSYLSNVHWVANYYFSPGSSSSCKKTIRNDTFKCMGIGGALNWLIRFGLGQVHYLRVIKWILFGMGCGFGYSFYFTAQKVDSFMVRKRLGLNEE